MSGTAERRDIEPAGNAGNAQLRSGAVYLLPLVALTAVYTVGLAFLMGRRLPAPQISTVIYPVIFSLLLTGWVRNDRRIRSLRVPFEFDAFVYFFWPLMVPYYLARTRGWIGFLFGVGICGLFVAPYITAAIIYAAVTL